MYDFIFFFDWKYGIWWVSKYIHENNNIRLRTEKWKTLDIAEREEIQKNVNDARYDMKVLTRFLSKWEESLNLKKRKKSKVLKTLKKGNIENPAYI